MHDPNTYSQLRMLGLTTPNARRYEHDETMRRTQSQLAEQEGEEEDVKRMLRKQQVCVEGALVTLIVLSVVALVVILVIVLSVSSRPATIIVSGMLRFPTQPHYWPSFLCCMAKIPRFPQ